jgi:hypothetical protein
MVARVGTGRFGQVTELAGGEVPACRPARGLYHLQRGRDLKINETVDLPDWLASMTLPRGIFA